MDLSYKNEGGVTLLSLLLARDGPGDLGDLSLDRDRLLLGGGLFRLASFS